MAISAWLDLSFGHEVLDRELDGRPAPPWDRCSRTDQMPRRDDLGKGRLMEAPEAGRPARNA
jgi:hypothetical protein